MNAEEFAGALHPVVYRELSGQTHWWWSQQDHLCEQLMGPAGVRGAPPEFLHIPQLLPSPPQPQPVGIGSFQVLWPKSRGSYDLLSHISFSVHSKSCQLYLRWIQNLSTFLTSTATISDWNMVSHLSSCFASKSILFSPAAPRGLWDLSSPTKGWTGPPAMRAQSPPHRTTGEFIATLVLRWSGSYL